MDNMNTSCFPIALAALKKANTANERIDNLPLPMVFKGSLGTGGTISTLPTASSENEGFVYIVITDGTYAGISAKAGDTFVSDGSEWVLVPSADEPSVIDDSVTSTALTWSSKKISDECKVKSFTYTGDGTTVHDVVFPEKPTFILGIYATTNANHWVIAPFYYGCDFSFSNLLPLNFTAGLTQRTIHLSYNDKTITIDGGSESWTLNANNITYTVYYI